MSDDKRIIAEYAEQMAARRRADLEMYRGLGFYTHVEIIDAGQYACEAVTRYRDKPVPIEDVPELPLPGCDQDYCRCMIVAVDDLDDDV